MASPLTALFQKEIIDNPRPSEQGAPLRGLGGGMADAIPAEIDGEELASLSEGEFVIPADVVSFLGDGASDAGARMLQKMIDDIRSKVKGPRGLTAALEEME